jgi:ABC-type transport system involved in multi-copper enzyme maturation permease subunit
MSALSGDSIAAPRAGQPVLGAVTQGRVIRSEWTKLWSLRSTRWSLLVAFVAQAGLGPLIAAVRESRFQFLLPHAILIDHSLAGFHISQLAIAVLGVLVISGEYGTGSIRSSLLAVPKRLPVLWAKLIVFGTVTFVLILISTVIGFLGAQAIFAEHQASVSLSQAPALRAVIGNALYLTATGVVCVGLGTIIRATAGGISAFVFVLFVLPGLVEILPSNTANAISPYLPSNAGTAVNTAFVSSTSLSPWGGFALFCGYTLLVVAAGAYLLRRRDA